MRLIVGVVDRGSGDDAVALAERCARSAGFDLDLCTVVAPIPAGDPDLAVEARYAHRDETALSTLREIRGRLGPDIVAEIHLRHDDSPAHALSTMARQLGADAIVIGSGPEPGDDPAVSGGVASALLDASQHPIILAPRSGAHRGVERLGAITCALGPRSPDGLVHTAALCARVADAPLRVMSLLVPGADGHPGSGSRDAMYQRLADATLRAQTFLPVDFPVTSVLVEGDSIGDAAARLEWGPADVVIVGSSRRTSPRRTVIGSAAAAMVRVLNVATVVVPRDAHAGDIPADVDAHAARVTGVAPTPTIPL